MRPTLATGPILAAIALAAMPAAADVRGELGEMAKLGRPLTLEHAQAFVLACDAEVDPAGCERAVLERLPNWEILVDSDQITDAGLVIMRRPAEHGSGAVGISCRAGVSWVVFDLPGLWNAGPYRAVIRVDQAEPEPWIIWQQNGKLSVDAQPVVADLWRARQLAIRATDDTGSEVTAVFNVAALAEESYWLVSECPNLDQD